MKARRNVYIIIGAILIIANLYLDIEQTTEIYRIQHSFNMYDSIGGLLGSNLLLIFGIILLRWAYKIQKKIRGLVNEELENAIENIGNDTSQT